MSSPSEATYPFVKARYFRAGRIDRIRYVGVHCTVSPDSMTGAEATARYFQTTDRPASAHVTVDPNSVVRSVHDWDTAFAAKGFNANGLHVELVGMPNQTRAQWLDVASRATIKNAAKVIGEWCMRYRLRPENVSITNLRANTSSGMATHATMEKAKPSTGHWDPGPNFPMDVLLTDVRNYIASRTQPARRLNPYLDYAAPCYRQPGVNQGGKVRFVEWALGLPIDGIFGDDVNAAVRALQHKHGRPVTGKVGDPAEPGNWTLEFLKTITR